MNLLLQIKLNDKANEHLVQRMIHRLLAETIQSNKLISGIDYAYLDKETAEDVWDELRIMKRIQEKS